jgi:hypothetical protein
MAWQHILYRYVDLIAGTLKDSSPSTGANISNELTISSFRVGNHQPGCVTGRDHRVNLHIVHNHTNVVVVHGMFCSAEHIVEDTVHENGHYWPLQ